MISNCGKRARAVSSKLHNIYKDSRYKTTEFVPVSDEVPVLEAFYKIRDLFCF